MKTNTGIAEKMFAALASEKISMKMITTGEIKISVLVDKADAEKALRAVHSAFSLEKPRYGAGASVGDVNHSKIATRQSSQSSGDLVEITQQLASMEEILVSEIHQAVDQGRITLFGLPDKPGNSLAIFQAVASGGIVVDMIVQNLCGEKVDLSFSVPREKLQPALTLAIEAAKSIDVDIQASADSEIATLYVLGVGMRTHTGVARRIFGSLASAGINILMINTSETCISVVVQKNQGKLAEEKLKKVFDID
jgi:aspartate kinase